MDAEKIGQFIYELRIDKNLTNILLELFKWLMTIGIFDIDDIHLLE